MGKNYILWIAYFDCSLKRKYGRRISLDFCIDNPRLNELLEACKKLNIECDYVDKKYPRTWYKGYGFIVAKNVDIKKNELLKIIAKEVKNIRMIIRSSTGYS